MKACAYKTAGCVFDRDGAIWPELAGSKKVAPKVADTSFLWANLFQWDYLLSRPLED